MVRKTCLVPGTYKYQHLWRGPAIHRLIRLRIPPSCLPIPSSQTLNNPSTSGMFSYGNNFASSSSSYLDEQNNNLDLHGYSFDVNSNWSSASTTLTVAFDFNASIAGPSTVTEDQWLEPPSNGEYAESTVLDAPWGGSTDQYGFQTGPAQSSNVFETSKSRVCPKLAIRS